MTSTARPSRPLLYVGPHGIAIVVFFAGILNIVSALIASPWIRFIQRLIPLAIFDASRTLTVISGILLLILAHGLWQRKHRAWVLSVILIILSLFSHLVKGGDIVEMIALAIPLLLLFVYRWEFTVRSVRSGLFSRMKTFSIVVACLVIYIVAGFSLLQNQFAEPVTIHNVVGNYENVAIGLGDFSLRPLTIRARWFRDSLFTINLILVALVFTGLFSPFIQHSDPTEEELLTVKKIVDEWGDFSVSYFALLNDKQYFLNTEQSAVIAYKISNNTAIVLGEPIGPPELHEKIIQEFSAQMQKFGLSTAFYLVNEEHLRTYKKMGLTLLKIGEEAIVNPQHFDLKEPAMKNIRNSLSHIQRAGVSIQWYQLDQVPGSMMVQVNSLFHEWLRQKAFPELGFANDFYPLPLEKNGYVTVAFDQSGQLLCALSFLPYKKGRALALDGMFRSTQAVSGVVESAIAESLLLFRQKNISELSLGLVALAHTQPDVITAPLVQRGRSLLFKHFNQFYNYKSLFAFKEKFQPRWAARYVAFSSNTEILKVALAIIGVQTQKTFPSHMVEKTEHFLAKRPLLTLVALAFFALTLFAISNNWSQLVTFTQHVYYGLQQPTTPTVHQSQVVHLTFYSKALHQQRDAYIYLPQEYQQNPQRRFPVLYLLHGQPGSNEDWFINAHLEHTINDMIDQHELRPLIVVCPDGTGPKVFDSQYVNATHVDQEMATNIADELVSAVDQNYRTIAARESRAIGGISSGAYGSINLSLHYPQKFSVILSMSGYFINHEVAARDLFGNDQAAHRSNNPLEEIKPLSIDPKTSYFLHINRQEDPSWIAQQHQFTKILQSKNVDVEDTIGVGGHGWGEWQHDVIPALIFLNQHLKF